MAYSKLKTSSIGLPLCIALALSACGGGGGSSSSENNENIDTVDVIDPIITLTGLSIVEVIQGANYVELGAVATDNRDGNISNNIIIAGDQVDTSAAPGTTFTITYNVSDVAQNPAIEVIRSVSIITSSTSNQIPSLSNTSIQNYLNIINSARGTARSCGEYGNFPAVSDVTWSDKLYKASYEHSQDLSESNTFSHNGSNTISDWSGYLLGRESTLSDRVATYGYVWSSLSENITAGTNTDTAQEAVDSWLASDGHCKNLMSSSVTEVGLALSTNQNSTYTHYWTQNFGKPR